MIDFTIRSLTVPVGTASPEAVLDAAFGKLQIEVRRKPLAVVDGVPLGIVARRLTLWIPTAAEGHAFEFRDDTTGRVILGIRPDRFGWHLTSGYQQYWERRTWPLAELTNASRRFLNAVIMRLRDDPGVNAAPLLTSAPVYAMARPDSRPA